MISFGERVSADIVRDRDMSARWITQVTLNLTSIVVRDTLKETHGAGGGGHKPKEEVGSGARAQEPEEAGRSLPSASGVRVLC